MRTGSWPEWSEAAFGATYEIWHDGLSMERVTHAYISDPDTAVAMIIQGIESLDPLAADVVAHLARSGTDVSLAVPALRAQVAAEPEDMRVTLAACQALYLATGEDAWEEGVFDSLLRVPAWSVRINAALALRDFAPSSSRIDALAMGVQDPDYLVRFHSAGTLLRYAGETREVHELPVFRDVVDEPPGDASDRHKRAADHLAALAAERLAPPPTYA